MPYGKNRSLPAVGGTVSRIEDLVIYVPIRHLYNCRESSTNRSCFMQNKANVKIGKMSISIARIKDYDKKQRRISSKRYSKQTQTKPISEVPILQYVAKWGPSDYPCVFELAGYNLVLRGCNLRHSMPNVRNLDGEYMKWQKPRKQTQ